MELEATNASMTSTLVMKALDFATTRHGVIATNIANANNPAYQPMRLSFGEQLNALKAELVQRDGAADGRFGDWLRPEAYVEHAADGDALQKVRLDEEIANMVQNAIYYQALLNAQGRSKSIIRMAINEGRG